MPVPASVGRTGILRYCTSGTLSEFNPITNPAVFMIRNLAR